MLFTNGRILIDQENNKEILGKAADKIEKHFLEEKGIAIEFKESADHHGFALIVPEEVSWSVLHAMLVPNIEFKAINENEIVMPKPETISIKYVFKDDEMKEIADENMARQVEFEKLEASKKATMAEFKGKLDFIEERIKETRIKHMNGYEEREFDCFVKLDFVEKKKYFIDKYDGTTIRKVEDLSKRDYQVPISHRFEGTLTIPFAEGEGTKDKPFIVQLTEKDDEDDDKEEEDEKNETTMQEGDNQIF